MDRRRRQYVPMSVYLASSTTGQKILAEFGLEGIAVWACYLCACKTNWVQGQVTYAGEADGLTKLGLYPHKPSFTLEDFFDFTGRLKLTKRMQDTRKRGVGQVQDVRCTKWGQWSIGVERELDAEKKRSKRAQNTRTLQRHNSDDTGTLQGTEVEGKDKERTRPRASPNGRADALQKAATIARNWTTPDSDAFATRLDQHEREHHITLRTLERETLWDTAHTAALKASHTQPAPPALRFVPSGSSRAGDPQPEEHPE